MNRSNSKLKIKDEWETNMMTPRVRKEPLVLSEYFDLNGILTLLFSVAGLLAAGLILTLSFSGGASAEGILQGIVNRNSVFSWYASGLLLLSALVTISLSRHSARTGDRRIWAVFGVFLAILSCQEAASLKDAAGWVYFSGWELASAPWMAGVLMIPFFLLGLGLRKALKDSWQAASCLVYGAGLYAAGAVGQAVTVGSALSGQEGQVWPLLIIFESLLRGLGAVVLLAGFLLHERFLAQQLRRLRSPSSSFGLPEVNSATAAWALRMIDTPTRDEAQMMEEIRRVRLASKKAEKAGENV